MMRKVLLVVTIALMTVNSYGQMGEWTWMNGSDSANSSGYFDQTFGMFDSLNSPDPLYEPCEWTDLNGNFWLFSGIGGNGLQNSLWEFNPNINQWALIKAAQRNGVYGTFRVPAPNNNPSQRGLGVPTWVDTAGDLWLFGGQGFDVNGVQGILNDLWRYNIASNEWTWMSGSDTINNIGSYGTILVSSASNNPPGRSETNASWTDNNNNLWLFGGCNDSTSNLDEMWKYDLSINEWTWMKGPDSLNYNGVYGIVGVPDSLNNPCSRYCYSKWKDSNGNLWLFGGFDNYVQTHNDLWRFNPVSNEWTWMKGPNIGNDTGTIGSKCSTSITSNPKARYENRACWTLPNDNFVFFGGGFDQSSTYYNDLWNYNVSNNSWTLMSGSTLLNQAGNYGTKTVSNPNNMPPNRYGSVGWKDNMGNLWMFGGGSNNGSLNDMWRFVPDTNCINSGIPQSTPNSPAISLYPNPNNGTFTLSYHLSNCQLSIVNCQLKITDVTGRTLYSLYISNLEGQETLTLPLSSGIYFWQMQNDAAIIGNGKVVIIRN
jgi:N-acetylneuraminic acid mutarotase